MAACNNLGNTLQAMGRREEAIAAYEAALAIDPSSAEAHNNLGTSLQALGRLSDAASHYRQALSVRAGYAEAHYNLANTLHLQHEQGKAIGHYREAISLRPGYVEAHTGLGTSLLALHRCREAVEQYQQALALRPDHLGARNNLGIALREMNRFDEALAQHLAALQQAPSSRQVHQALAVLFLKCGQPQLAQVHARAGFGSGIEEAPWRGPSDPVRVLVLVSALGGNLRTEQWLDPAVFSKAEVTTEFWDQTVDLPLHDVVFNAVGDADLCQAALAAAEALAARTHAPILNAPSRILATTRIENARRLGQLPGVVTPKMALYSREAVHAARLARDGFDFPLLLRSPGFHTGEHFLRVDASKDLRATVASLPGGELLAIEYVDTFDSDGTVRKYRVLCIDGQLYPLHLAISRRWMVHYLSADMAESTEHRAEDARFLEDMPGVLGPRVMAAIERVAEALALDYGGVDFGIDYQGRLVVWEANATMAAPLPDEDERWAYRLPAIQRVDAAVRSMLLERAASRWPDDLRIS